MDRREVMSTLCQQTEETFMLLQNMFKLATKDIDLTYPQFMIMKVIASKSESSMGEIVKILSLDQGNVSHMCKNLEKKGWVKRQRTPTDERVVLVSLTTAGQDVIEHISNFSYEQFQKILTMISDQDVQHLLDSFQMLIKCCYEVIEQQGGQDNVKV